MDPAQFRTQRVANWKCLVEDPNMPQVRDVETPPKLCGERRSQALQEPSPILRPCETALFELDDMSANLPAGVHLNSIDSP